MQSLNTKMLFSYSSAEGEKVCTMVIINLSLRRGPYEHDLLRHDSFGSQSWTNEQLAQVRSGNLKPPVQIQSGPFSKMGDILHTTDVLYSLSIFL